MAETADKNPFEEFKKTLTAKGRRIWDILEESNSIIIERDFILLNLLIETYEDYDALKNEYKKRKRKEDEPRIHKNLNGTVQTHPYIQQMRELRTDIKSLTAQLGLSPLAAAKLKIMDQSDAETVAELMKQDR